MADAQGGMDLEAVMAEAEETRSRIEMVQRQLDILGNAEADKVRAQETLEAIQGGAEGSDVLFPVGGNTFVPAKLGKVERVIKGVGGGYALPRDVAAAIEDLKKEVEQVRSDAQSLGQSLSQLEARYQQLVSVLQQQQGMAAAPPA